MKKKLKPAQERFWNRLTGSHNARVRQQIEYMRKSGTLAPSEYDYLIEQSYTTTEAEIWRLIIDHIRVRTMQDFNMTFHKPPRKRRKNKTKKR
jgi:hypothetical protein